MADFVTSIYKKTQTSQSKKTQRREYLVENKRMLRSKMKTQFVI